MAIYSDISTVTAKDVLPTTYLNQIVDNMALFTTHDHSPSSGEGGNVLKVASATASLTDRIYLSPINRTEFNGTVGGTNPQFITSSLMLGANAWGWNLTATNACGDGANVKLPLFKGKYQVQILYIPALCGGTACLTLDSSFVGTVDTYGTAGSSLIKTIAGMVAPSSKSYTLLIQQVVSNASSTGSRIELGTITVVKTSN